MKILTSKTSLLIIITNQKRKGKTAICKVAVTDNYIAVTGAHWLINDPFVLYVGNSMRMRDKISIEPYNATDKSIKWKSSNSSAASIDSTTGIIKGLKVGNTQITGTLSNGKTITINVQVRNNPSNYAINIRRVAIGHGGQNYYRYYVSATFKGEKISNCRNLTYNGKSVANN